MQAPARPQEDTCGGFEPGMGGMPRQLRAASIPIGLIDR
jgi:hypothetical protein